MSDFLGALVDRHTDKLGKGFVIFLWGIIILLALYTMYHSMSRSFKNVAQSVGSGASVNVGDSSVMINRTLQ